jgi:hypothetical protein
MMETDRRKAIEILIGAIKMASLYMELQHPGTASNVVGGNIHSLMLLGVTQEEVKQALIDAKFLREDDRDG